MFWGRGDTSRLNDEEKKTLNNLRRLVETEHIIAWDYDDAALILRAMNFYMRWESVFALAKSLKNVMLLFTFFIGAYWATEGAIVSWIVQRISGN